MSKVKKTSRNQRTALRAKRSRAVHSDFLKRFHGEPRKEKSGSGAPLPVEIESARLANPVNASKPASLFRNPDLEKKPNSESDPYLKIVSHTSQSRVIEQRITYSPRPGQPWIAAELRLTTALRGRRLSDGLAEGAYLFRLEVLKTTPGIKVSGFNLGPWRAENLDLETGNIFLAEPLWAGFAAVSGRCRGRLLLYDLKRKCVLDLPWIPEALMPGPEPL